MSDQYLAFANSSLGRTLVDALGLPRPPVLERYTPGIPAFSQGHGILGMAAGGYLMPQVAKILAAQENVIYSPEGDAAHNAAAGSELILKLATEHLLSQERFKTVVYDASGIDNSNRLSDLHRFFHPIMRQIAECGRIVVLGCPPDQTKDAAHRTAQRALEGFTRSLGKEIKKGATAQLIYVAPEAEL
ncbi:MAG: short chain dehydrogenase, partial [Pseudomonadales bacterium]|nr:short chain dehydrogenase [Pseudomonadales bacterium]